MYYHNLCSTSIVTCAVAGYSSGYSGYNSGYYYGDPGPASYTPVYNYYSSTPYYSNPGSYGYDTNNNSALLAMSHHKASPIHEPTSVCCVYSSFAADTSRSIFPARKGGHPVHALSWPYRFCKQFAKQLKACMTGKRASYPSRGVSWSTVGHLLTLLPTLLLTCRQQQ